MVRGCYHSAEQSTHGVTSHPTVDRVLESEKFEANIKGREAFWATFFGVVLLMIGVIVYFFPTLMARSVSHRNADAITVLNLFLGWTLVGWVVALCWAMYKSPHGKPSSP